MLQSTYLKTSQANWIKGTAYPTAPTSLWVSLHDGDPSLTGANEITTDVAAARLELTASTDFSAISTVGTRRQRLIDVDISYGNAIDDGSATYWGLWDDDVAGNYLGGSRLLDTSGAEYTLTIVNGEEIFIGANSLIIGYPLGVFSTYFIDKILGWFSGTAFGTAPTNIYAALGANLFSHGTGTYLGIDREIITFGSNTTVDNYVQIGNNAVVNFDNSPSATTLNSCGFFDASVSGNLISVGSYSDLSVATTTPLFFNTNTVRMQF